MALNRRKKLGRVNIYGAHSNLQIDIPLIPYYGTIDFALRRALKAGKIPQRHNIDKDGIIHMQLKKGGDYVEVTHKHHLVQFGLYSEDEVAHMFRFL